MICIHCGMENEEGAEICAFCGEELRMDEEPSLVDNDDQVKPEERRQEKKPHEPDRSTGGGAKTFLAVTGCGFLLIAMITAASYFLFKDLLSSVSDWWEERPTTVAISQPTLIPTTSLDSMGSTQPSSVATSPPTSMATTQPTSPSTAQPTDVFPTPDKVENLFFGIRSDTVYRPFTSIGILRLDTLEEEIIVAEPNGLLPLVMIPEEGQSFISPDRKWVALSSGYGQSTIYIFQTGNPEPFYEIDGHPDLGQFHSYSPNGRYFAYPSRDLQTSEFILNVLDLEHGELHQQNGLLYGIFLPGADQAIGFRIGPSEDKLISLDQIDFLNNQTTPLLDLDLTIDHITYIPPFLSQDGEFVFYVDGDFLMSFSIPDGETRSVYKFQYVINARAFLLHQSELVVIMDSLDPEIADLHLYHPQTDLLVNVDRRVSSTPYYLDSRNFANVPPIAISPDGTRIAYAGGFLGEMELRIAELDGGEVTTLSDRVHFISFEFSPDNQKIAYIEFTDSSQYGDLYITDIQGKARSFLDINVISFEFISSGADIVYSKFDSPDEEISRSSVYRIGVEGGAKETLLDEAGTFVFIHTP
jgi:WD40 repeat protein